MGTRAPATWAIAEAVADACHQAIGFRRPWETTRIHVPVLDLAAVREDLEALERLDRDHPGWYGCYIPTVPVSRLSGLWAQYPGVVVVTADRPAELERRIAAALITHGL